MQDFDYFGDSFKAWCLVPAKSKAPRLLPRARARACADQRDGEWRAASGVLSCDGLLGLLTNCFSG